MAKGKRYYLTRHWRQLIKNCDHMLKYHISHLEEAVNRDPIRYFTQKLTVMVAKTQIIYLKSLFELLRRVW